MSISSSSSLDDKLAQIEAEIADKLAEIDAEIADKLSQIDPVIVINGDDQLVGNDTDGLIDTSGGISADSIIGGNGNDVIKAGLGNDTLTGGFGADSFAFDTPNEGVDTITDFSAAEGDKLQVSAIGFGIAPNDLSRFSFDNVTGALFFDNLQLASLPLDSGFTLTTDIIIV
jgi:Ca2+-binding RTX toxin-like protein